MDIFSFSLSLTYIHSSGEWAPDSSISSFSSRRWVSEPISAPYWNEPDKDSKFPAFSSQDGGSPHTYYAPLLIWRHTLTRFDALFRFSGVQSIFQLSYTSRIKNFGKLKLELTSLLCFKRHF